ncbi:imidazoleglycerol-phosphate dehydratase HisB [Desulfuromonas acetoxidans]|uniref:Imidazoleglycerol-phosphate dehydratase n=1 Tax=Desulfuromonas acetoxidans (strain DSM 684 / 11070) TaxID=281689 RepID=Q1K276_DESA6|nr:imidazoleglycerol-phosphate dehydratase HisB [Desulfuromonas acetoxidans]EAT16563.1 Imidazoleglycerol-phosphate dehydratase [Desulfuromonas acetoxidans DSM 684]MBF0644472.1 imidazoleglycerol-phosphate dehydratase HisB [Desulfuromonas acetoxidans]NVD24674.1 imidazoleglycerol-phosphate dehydratase HisB [Desulfuromonas acetoxidans]NVE16719.1 imidazoleglycerol-phosphate dehydratase HisB [Desulfuromonas acetoxidans]
MSRTACIERRTAETTIDLKLDLDGSGQGEISTSVPFLDHMLILLKGHGFFDLTIQAQGDVEIDDHHTVEDMGICLGEAFKQALGDKKGIRRYGRFTMPMHEALASVILDFSGRPHLVFNVDMPKAKVGQFDTELVEEFFVAFCNHAGVNLHINLAYGSNLHHIIEAIFKGFGRALDEATQIDPRISGVMSTKGKLE